MFRSVITGTGSYIPPVIQSNEKFSELVFYSDDKKPVTAPSVQVVEKFTQITGIKERRYATDELNSSDIAALAAEEAIIDSGVNREEIDQLILAHNFGNVYKHTIQTDSVPALACLVKHKLGIHNPSCVPYDVIFGCPGWIQGLIQADAFFKAGIARKALVVGSETLSRVIDPYDRDSMIFSDGAGATVVEYKQTTEDGPGILGTAVQNHASEGVNYINMGRSYHPESDPQVRYIKMKGRKVYEYAMKHVPLAMKDCLEKSKVDISQLKKIFIHQANEKMDEGIVKRFYQLYGIEEPPQDIMPMSIHWLGNSSVATVPTLYDLVRRNQLVDHSLEPGDIILFASVGAGMNINAVCYRYG
jgi:3-oxoacyl-[acyl-carrier-protein] synthase-3